jgi:hypothetical protein
LQHNATKIESATAAKNFIGRSLLPNNRVTTKSHYLTSAGRRPSQAGMTKMQVSSPIVPPFSVQRTLLLYKGGTSLEQQRWDAWPQLTWLLLVESFANEKKEADWHLLATIETHLSWKEPIVSGLFVTADRRAFKDDRPASEITMTCIYIQHYSLLLRNDVLHNNLHSGFWVP